MATTEEFLIQLGLDEASVRNVINQIQSLKGQADTTVTVDVQTNAAGAATEVAAATETVGTAAEQSFAIFEDGIRDAQAGLLEMRTTLIAVAGAATLITGIGFASAAEESRNLARANVILNQTNEELSQTQAELRAIADETGLTYVQVSAALFDVASAGFAGQEAIDAIRVSAQAAIPAGIEVKDAFNAIATAIRNFGVNADEAGDKLVRIADLTRGTLQDVANAVALAGPTAARAGLSFNELGAAFATITSTGQTGEIAATLLFNALQAFIKPAEEAKEVLKDLEIVTGDNAFKSQDLAEKIRILAQAAADGRVSIGQLFNQRALRGINALIGNVNLFAENLDKVQDSAGRVQEGVDAFFKSAGPQLDLLKVAFLNVATVIGTDLLKALVPVITATTDFIAENRELIVLLTKAGLVVGSLAAAWLAYRVIVVQVNAASRVLSGISRALIAILTFETGSITSNVAAWYSKLTAEQALANSPVLRLIGRTIAILGTETGVVFANAAAWLRNVGSRLWSGFTTFLANIAASILALTQESAVVAGSSTAFVTNAGARGLASRAATGLGAILGKNVATMSLGTTAALGLGAAIAGWKIGSAINEWLELNDVFERFVEGNENATDRIKVGFLSIIPGLSTYLKYLRASNEASRKWGDSITEQQRGLIEARGATDKYNQFIEAGIEPARAFAAAIGSVAIELAVLRELEAKGVATERQVQRIAFLEGLRALRNEQSNEAIKEGTKLIGIQARAVTDLARTAEDWAKFVQRTNTEFEKLTLGGLAGGLEAVREFDTDFQLILTRFTALNSQLGSVQSEIASGDLGESRLAEAKAVAEQSTQDIAQAYETLRRRVQIAQARLISIEEEYVADLRAKAQERIDVIRQEADQQIQVQQDLLAQSQALFDQLISERERAIASVERFADRLEQAQLRRADPALAEQISLERDFNQAIKDGIESAEQQARILNLLRQELERLAGPTDQEIRLQEQLADIRRQLQEGTADRGGQEQRNRLIERERQLAQEVLEAAQNRAKREETAARILETANKRAARSQQEFAARDEEIEFTRDEIAETTEKIKTATEAVETAESGINAELDKQIAKRKVVLQQQLDAIKNAEDLAKKVGAAALEQGRGITTPAVQQGAETAQEEFKQEIGQAKAFTTEAVAGAEEIRQNLDAVKQQSDQVKSFIDTVKATLQSTVEAIKLNSDKIAPAAQELSQNLAGVSAAFEPSENALKQMVDSTNSFAPRVESFGEAVTDSMKKQSARLDTATSRLGALERQVRALTETGGGASGLPN